MGNGTSTPDAPRMAFSAMADMMKITKPQFMDLREACLHRVEESISKKKSTRNFIKSPDITREQFRAAMKDVNLDMNDFDVLDHLFTMNDKYGEEVINLIVFLAGVSPLASAMETETKILFAFEVFDIDSTGRLRRSDAKRIFEAINATASYFGDPVISSKAIDNIIEDVYKDQSEIFFDEYVDLFAEHPAVVQFTSSGGPLKYDNGQVIKK